MDTHLPEGFSPEGSSNDSNASGNQIHLHGLSTGMGLAIAALAACALGVSIVDSINNAAARADQRSRYEESYRELSREVRLNTQATDDMRASLIARGINPNNHDVTDVGGAKP